MSGTTVSSSGSRQNQNSGVTFPGQFLGEFQNRFGRGLSLEELYGLLPQTQSIFGGGPVGFGGLPGGAGAGGQMPGGGGGQAPGTVSLDQISAALASQAQPGRPQLNQRLIQGVREWAEREGLDINALTREQLQNAAPGALPGWGGDLIRNTLPGMLDWGPAPGTGAAGPRFGGPTGGPDLSALQIPESIQRLFGTGAAREYSPYQFRDIPGITAPTSAAGLMDLAPGGFDRYENALFRSAYEPQARELARQGTLADQQQMAELAQAGLASSGSGLGQVQNARRDREQSRQNIATEAAYRATEQRFGAEFAQQQFNAQQRQQTNLANAGFDLEAQKTNAANVLAGDMARADNYLKTIGVNEQSAQAMRQDFLQLLGITQQELERLNASQVENLGLLLNNWLQQGALLGNLGQGSQGQSRSDSNTLHSAF